MAAVQFDPADLDGLGPAARAQVEAQWPHTRATRKGRQPHLTFEEWCERRDAAQDAPATPAVVQAPPPVPTPAAAVSVRQRLTQAADPVRVKLVGWSWSRALWMAAAVLVAFGAGVALGVYGTLRAAPWQPGFGTWMAGQLQHPAGNVAAGGGLAGAWVAAKWAERVLRWACYAGAAALVGHLALAGVRW